MLPGGARSCQHGGVRAAHPGGGGSRASFVIRALASPGPRASLLGRDSCVTVCRVPCVGTHDGPQGEVRTVVDSILGTVSLHGACDASISVRRGLWIIVVYGGNSLRSPWWSGSSLLQQHTASSGVSALSLHNQVHSGSGIHPEGSRGVRGPGPTRPQALSLLTCPQRPRRCGQLSAHTQWMPRN